MREMYQFPDEDEARVLAQRLMRDPGHPRPQVLQALGDGAADRGSVRVAPGPERQVVHAVDAGTAGRRAVTAARRRRRS